MNIGKRNRFVVSRLEGGLGNQMFQFAFASKIAHINNVSLHLDLNFYNFSHKKIDCTPRNFELDVFNVNYLEVTSSEISSFFKLSFFNRIKKKIRI